MQKALVEIKSLYNEKMLNSAGIYNLNLYIPNTKATEIYNTKNRIVRKSRQIHSTDGTF